MAKPEKYEIDILQMELDKKLPHWLDPMQRDPAKAEAIRKKHRDKYLAEQKQKKRSKAFQAARMQAQATLDRLRDFDPSQPRDEHGRWTDTGAGDDDGAEKPAAKLSLEPVPPPPPAARALGLNTVAYHATNQEFEEFKPGAWRGATFFGPTPKAALIGAAAGKREAIGDQPPSPEAVPINKIVGVYLRSDDIQGLSLSPAEKSWWKALPERTDGNGMDAALKHHPPRIDHWYTVYDEVKKGDDFEYVKRPIPQITYEQAQKTRKNVYGETIPHWGPETSEKKTADRVLAEGMSGWIVEDEAGVTIAHIDPGAKEKLRLASDFVSDTGTSNDGGTTATDFRPGIKAHNDTDAAKNVKHEWFAKSPFKADDIAGAMAAAEPAQKELGTVGEAIAKQLGIEFKNPGTKKNVERIKQKAEQRGGVHRVTDLSRAAFIIKSPEQADIIAAELAKHFEVAAEDWKVTPVNYADKALQLRFKNGTIGEIQVMDQAMADAKSNKPGGGKGHDLYVELRTLDPVKDKARFDAITHQMQTLYGGVLQGYSPSWRAALRRP